MTHYSHIFTEFEQKLEKLEKTHQNPINLKQPKSAKNGPKNQWNSLTKWVFGKTPTFLGKTRKTHFMREIH